jgi:acetoacetyl-CoA synthetase
LQDLTLFLQVEQLSEVLESIIIGHSFDSDVRGVHFVRLREGAILYDALVDCIKRRIRENTTLRHLPAKVLQVKDIPRTRSGKIFELVVHQVVRGHPVRNMKALANPEALEYFRDRPELAR